MKIQYCSDLHLEFTDNINWIDKLPIKAVGDILIIAGDMMPFIHLQRPLYTNDVASLCRSFEKVFWLPGNHEYYKSTHLYTFSRCERPISNIKNLFLVDNYTETIERTQFIFSTMWSHIGKKNQDTIQRNMSDFYYITVMNPKNEGTITPLEVSDFNHFNKVAVNFLKKEVKKATQAKEAGKIDHIIVATHYVPTRAHYPKIYAASPLNDAFAIELSDFIENSTIDYWIYGHHHFNQPNFKIGNTQLLTNQLGYVMRDEQVGFDWGKYIEV
jgi:ser/thr protein phosphatase family protein